MSEEIKESGSVAASTETTASEEVTAKEPVAAAANATAGETFNANTAAQPQAPAAKNNLMACIAYCPALFFVPFLTGDSSKNEVARNSMNQGFLCLLMLICVNLMNTVISLLPYSIARIGNIMIMVLSLVITVFVIVGMVRGYNNKIFKLPLIGHIDIFQKIKGEN